MLFAIPTAALWLSLVAAFPIAENNIGGLQAIDNSVPIGNAARALHISAPKTVPKKVASPKTVPKPVTTPKSAPKKSPSKVATKPTATKSAAQTSKSAAKNPAEVHNVNLVGPPLAAKVANEVINFDSIGLPAELNTKVGGLRRSEDDVDETEEVEESEPVALEARLDAEGCPTSASDFTSANTNVLPPNQAIFYSAVSIDGLKAFAKANNRMLVEAWLDQSFWTVKKQSTCPSFWDFASQAYARDASGQVVVVLAPLTASQETGRNLAIQNVPADKIWTRIESVELFKNPKVTSLIRTDLQKSHEWKCI